MKLTDFGDAVQLSHASSYIHPLLGSPEFSAPELVLGQPASLTSDIWSLGLLHTTAPKEILISWWRLVKFKLCLQLAWRNMINNQPVCWLVCRGGDIRCPKWCFSLPGWELRGDMSERLSPGLQLSGGLLPGSEPGCQGLCLPAAPERARTTAHRVSLPAGAVAPAPRSDQHWIRWPETCTRVAQPSRFTSGHIQTNFLHWEAETPERRSAHRHGQGLPPQPPAKQHLTRSAVGPGAGSIEEGRSWKEHMKVVQTPLERTTSNVFHTDHLFLLSHKSPAAAADWLTSADKPFDPPPIPP